LYINNSTPVLLVVLQYMLLKREMIEIAHFGRWSSQKKLKWILDVAGTASLHLQVTIQKKSTFKSKELEFSRGENIVPQKSRGVKAKD